jgi:hypothetical protein
MHDSLWQPAGVPHHLLRWAIAAPADEPDILRCASCFVIGAMQHRIPLTHHQFNISLIVTR